MKITIYELLGLVKDDKAPKKVKYKDKIYYYNKGYDFNYMYNSSDYSPINKDNSLFKIYSFKLINGRHCWNNEAMIDFLNDEVEILEEEKKIPEKLQLKYDDIIYGNDFKKQILMYCDNLQYKINEIIDYLTKELD